MKIASILSIAAALLISGCASVPMASPEADASAKAFQIDPSKAGIYIYRNEIMGAAIKMPVLLNNVSVGSTTAKTYIFHQVDPGTHVITSQSDVTLSLDVQAGSNYFVWQEVKMGALSARSQLHLVDEATGKAGVAGCKLVK
jgi:PBP1b-binding outer membrane lipoprotein LpoB